MNKVHSQYNIPQYSEFRGSTEMLWTVILQDFTYIYLLLLFTSKIYIDL